jgi:uncharacterized protein (TIGR03083 family)
MALDRTQVSDGLLEELDRFEQLVRSLDADAWERPSRCEGWTVGDVARHVVGSMADVVAGRVDGLGSPEATKREVDERAGRSPAELADECAEVRKATAGMLPLFDAEAWAGPAPGGYDGTLGDGVEALWYDLWLHADDIRSALGRPTEVGTGLPGALSHVAFELAKRGWTGEVPSADDPAAAVPFVLSATGRAPLRDGLLDIYAA